MELVGARWRSIRTVCNRLVQHRIDLAEKQDLFYCECRIDIRVRRISLPGSEKHGQ